MMENFVSKERMSKKDVEKILKDPERRSPVGVPTFAKSFFKNYREYDQFCKEWDKARATILVLGRKYATKVQKSKRR